MVPMMERLLVKPKYHFGPNAIYQKYSYSTAEPRTLNSSSFAQPQDMKIEDDFALTKLINGKTDMKLGITKKASEKLSAIAEADNNINSGIRIVVESGGCHGFQYDIKLTDVEKELKEEPDLLVFKRTGEDGNENAQLILDDSSLQILQESKLDYTKELIGSQFKMVESPYTTSACGCGSSFDFDFDKLQGSEDK